LFYLCNQCKGSDSNYVGHVYTKTDGASTSRWILSM